MKTDVVDTISSTHSQMAVAKAIPVDEGETRDNLCANFNQFYQIITDMFNDYERSLWEFDKAGGFGEYKEKID